MPAEHGEAAQHKSIFNKDQINDFIYIYSFGRRDIQMRDNPR